MRRIPFLFLLIVVLLGVFTPLTFFEGDKVLIGLDTWVSLRPSFTLRDWFYTWAHYSSLGKDVSSRVVNLPTQVLPLAIMERLGFSLATSQKIFCMAIFLLAGLSMYYLVLSIWEKKHLMAFIAALFYMFNPVMGGYWASFLLAAIFAIAASPLMLAFFIRGLKSKNYFPYAVAFALSTILYPAVSPPLYFILAMVFLVFLIYFFIQEKNKKRIIKFLLLSGFLFLIVNAWWWMNIARTYFTVPEAIELEYSGSRLLMSSLDSSFLNLFRFQTNYWGYSYWGDRVNNWVGFLYATKPFLIIISFAYTLIAFSSLLLARKNRLILLLCFSSLIFLFLSKGTHLPFGFVYEWLYRLPLFNTIRTPSHKFPAATAILFSFLIGWVGNEVFQRLKKKGSLIGGGWLLFIVVLILGGQWYFFTGDAIQNGQSAQPPVLTKFPDYYWQAADWLSEKGDFFRIFSLPGADIPTAWITYKWGFLGVYPIPSDIFKRPVIDKLPLNNYESFRWGAYALLGNYSDLPYPFLRLPSSDSVYKLLSLMNVKYILINHDVDWQHMHYGTEDPDFLVDQLKKQKEIFYEKSFGNLDFYRLDEEYQPPQIHTSTRSEAVYGDELSLHLLSSFPQWQPGSGILLNQKDSLVEQIYILVDLADSIREEELAQKDSEQTINFPYVRWSPQSKLYGLAILREQQKEKKITSPQLRLMTKLNHSSKRISELEKWGSQLSDENWQKGVGDYRGKMLEALMILDELREADDFHPLLTKVKSYLSAHESRLESILRGESDFRKKMVFEALDIISDQFQEEFGRKEASRLIYQLDVPEAGNYEIFVRDDDWVFRGKRQLDLGENTFSLNLPEPSNLINKSGWLEKDNVSFLKEKFAKDTKLKILSQEIKGLQPNALYRIEFDYQFDGSLAGLALVEDEGKPLFVKKLRCGGDRQRHFETIYRSGLESKSTKLFLFFTPERENQQIALENFVVGRVFEPRVLFRFVSDSSKPGIEPVMSYTKVDSTKYRVKIEKAKDPYRLIFSETFSPDWEAVIDGKNIAEDKHQLINGYANSWLVEPTDSGGQENYEIVLNYRPQRIFYSGLLISSLGCLGCVGYLIFRWLRR